ncbi:MAG: hypothetical protein HYR85_24560 [Planctomycetes bacterium]|nr:hypothetical protein [Planctomycetota bacterium]MBI3845779.1 hypothetical protein [Planctomycetota bacterium]
MKANRTLSSWAFALTIAPAVVFAQQPDVSVKYHLDQGRHFRDIDNASRAASHFQAAIQADPKGVEAFVELASLLESLNELDDARLLAAAALARGPSNAAARAIADRLGLKSGEPASEPAQRLVARYLGIDVGVGGGREEGSLALGAKIDPDLLLVAGFTEADRLARIEPTFTVSSGLAIEGGDVRTIHAGDKPSAEETITVTDGRAGATGRASLRVVGPVAKLNVNNSRAKRLVLPEEPLAAGIDFTFSLSLLDAAGNRLWRPKVSWLARAVGESKATGWLVDAESVRHRDFFFEPHRNHVVVPATASEKDVVEVTAREPGSGVSATFRVRLATAADRVVASGAAPIFPATFEEALASAKKDHRLAMVVFTADW